jgi:hypothetical protein
MALPYFSFFFVLPSFTLKPNILISDLTAAQLLFPFHFVLSPDSVVGIATTGTPRGRSSSPGRVKNFIFSKSSRPALRFTQSLIQWVPGALYSGVKRPGREVDHSPPTSAEVKKMWVYTSTPHTPSWRSAWLVKHRDNFTLPLPHFSCGSTATNTKSWVGTLVVE